MKLKSKLNNRELVFGSWVSFSHPSITEIFADRDFDFVAIDMEHTTISLEQAQRIIAASQSKDVPCLPRPVSHSNDWIKPLLDSGANGIIAPLVSNEEQNKDLVNKIKFPPIGNRSFGVNRAHNYGLEFEKYVTNWNSDSIYIAQIENKDAIANIDEILQEKNLDGVMVGPYDLSGSLGVPGKVDDKLVVEAEKIVIKKCIEYGVSCGTQISNFNSESVEKSLAKGYTFIIASSDLFILNNWADSAQNIISSYRN